MMYYMFILFVATVAGQPCVKDLHGEYHVKVKQIRSMYPVVSIVKDIIHPVDVKYMINITKNSSFNLSSLMELNEDGTQNLHGKNTDMRSSSTIYLPKFEDEVLDCIGKRISTFIHQPFTHMEPFQLTKYSRNQHYIPHWDWFYKKHKLNYQRTWTVFVYLKQATCGGTTHFPKLGLNISVPSGTGIIWSNLDYKGNGEYLTLHGGSKVTCDDTKIGLNVWFRNECYEWNHCPQCDDKDSCPEYITEEINLNEW